MPRFELGATPVGSRRSYCQSKSPLAASKACTLSPLPYTNSSPLEKINRSNVEELRVAWTWPLPPWRVNHRAQTGRSHDASFRRAVHCCDARTSLRSRCFVTLWTRAFGIRLKVGNRRDRFVNRINIVL